MPVPELVGQVVQAAEEPVVALNVPAAQAATLEPDPVYPAAATQTVMAVEPVAAPVPELVGQAVQAAADAVVALNVSAAQGVTEPAEPVWPTLATQAVMAVDAVVVPVPELGGQLVQAAELIAVL